MKHTSATNDVRVSFVLEQYKVPENFLNDTYTFWMKGQDENNASLFQYWNSGDLPRPKGYQLQ
jgi:hypothetical protein